MNAEHQHTGDGQGWPATPPADLDVRVDGWFEKPHEAFLSDRVRPGDVVVEVGSWLGKSTLWLARRVGPGGHVYAVDNFKGSTESSYEPRQWDQFVRNCWEDRANITPIRMQSKDGIILLAARGVAPNVVYVDAAHDYANAVSDLMLAGACWPRARLCGDDFDMQSVNEAAWNVAACLKRLITDDGRCYEIRA